MNTTRKIILIISLATLLFCSCVGAVAFADKTQSAVAVANLDQTDVLADLMTSETFDLTNYSWAQDTTTANPVLISFVEYCYSTISTYQSLYGLYVYLYNPGGRILATDGHKISIATQYLETDEGNKPSQYENFELKLIDVSDDVADEPDKSTKNMFWKFKVVDRPSDATGYTIQQRVNPSARQYDVVGIQLYTAQGDSALADATVKDYTIGCSYVYSGFATGMANTTANPLVCKEQHLDTIALDVHSTYYRSQTSNKGNGWHNDVNSVYFSVPDKYFKNYGELKRIKAEWYEFVTNDIVVTSNTDFYNNALKYIGTDTTTSFDDLRYSVADNYELETTNTTTHRYASWYWGNSFSMVHDDPWVLPSWGYKPNSNYDGRSATLMYLFNVASIQNYNPDLPMHQQGGVAAEVLGEYIENFAKNNPTVAGDTLSIGGKTYFQNLFRSDIGTRAHSNSFGIVQSGFNGKSTYDFDVDVGHLDYETWDWSQGSYWDNVSMMDGDQWAWFKALFNIFPEQEEELQDIKYIQMVDVNDLSMSKADFCKKYLINNNDYESFVAYCHSKMDDRTKFEQVVLFRFAVTDYYSSQLTIFEESSLPKWPTSIENQAYRAFGSVFLNFDIIQLTFKDDASNYHAIGVVADPINIYPDITPPLLIEGPSLDMMWVQILQLFFYFIIAVICIIVVVSTIKFAFRR